MKSRNTGDWFKVRVWSDNAISWNQLRALHQSEASAIAAAQREADKGVRAQAIHLVKKGKKVDVTVVFDSDPPN